jgi:hypothetical protein
MDKVLVAYATGHRRTGEVALAIGEQLTRAGISVDLRSYARAGFGQRYAAVVAGCAVRNGRWEEGALAYLRSHPGLSSVRTHLFQWFPEEQPGPLDPRLGEWLADHEASELVTFSGTLGPWSPSRRRQLWSLMPLTEDDLRWREIHRWAYALGTTLESQLALAS